MNHTGEFDTLNDVYKWVTSAHARECKECEAHILRLCAVALDNIAQLGRTTEHDRAATTSN
jgi:hypothetical protein